MTGLLIRQNGHRGPHFLAELGQNTGIQAVRFGEDARSAGEIPHPTRIDPAERETCAGEGIHQIGFQPTGGLQDDEGRRESLEVGQESVHPLRGVWEPLGGLVRPEGDVQMLFGNVNANEDFSVHFSSPWFCEIGSPFWYTGLGALATVRTVPKRGYGDPAPLRSYHLGGNGLPHPLILYHSLLYQGVAAKPLGVG
jgi:hypothetical protein